MKEILIKELQVGDIIYRGFSYRVVLNEVRKIRGVGHVLTKCIMAPTAAGINIGDEVWTPGYLSALLLVRDGEEV